MKKKFIGDMPGNKTEANLALMPNALKIYQEILKIVNFDSTSKIVVGIAGGSGVGKTTISMLLAELFDQDGIGVYIMQGDNYPLRIPVYNDGERLRLFRQAGLKALVSNDLLSKNNWEILHNEQLKFNDANYDLVNKYPWFKQYIDAGKEALKAYLGQGLELDFLEVNNILKQFHQHKSLIYLKRMGRSDTELFYEKVNFEEIKVIILEWTHALSNELVGVDVPVYLNSTPDQTLQYRLSRNKDNNIDSPFTNQVLEIEQKLLYSQVPKAKIIMTKEGNIIDYKTFLEGVTNE